MGRIIAALEQSGQLEKTLLVFMSDHGEMLGDHGLYLKGPHFYEEALRVPLVLHWPEGFESGIQFDGLVELIDLAPTFCEAASIPVYEGDR